MCSRIACRRGRARRSGGWLSWSVGGGRAAAALAPWAAAAPVLHPSMTAAAAEAAAGCCSSRVGFAGRHCSRRAWCWWRRCRQSMPRRACCVRCRCSRCCRMRRCSRVNAAGEQKNESTHKAVPHSLKPHFIYFCACSFQTSSCLPQVYAAVHCKPYCPSGPHSCFISVGWLLAVATAASACVLFFLRWFEAFVRFESASHRSISFGWRAAGRAPRLGDPAVSGHRGLNHAAPAAVKRRQCCLSEPSFVFAPQPILHFRDPAVSNLVCQTVSFSLKPAFRLQRSPCHSRSPRTVPPWAQLARV